MALEWIDYVNDPENAQIAADEGAPEDGRKILEGATDGILIYGIQQAPNDPSFWITVQYNDVPIGAAQFPTIAEAKAEGENIAAAVAAKLGGGVL